MLILNDTFTSIQESALSFANDILNSINQSVSETVGVDVLWFRLKPDQKNKDVIFQTYTLYGVEDCPLEFKVIYTDTSYNDAAITYQMMGLNYEIPLTLEIAVNTWKEVTGNDGTIPQKGDVVFIPLSRKLLQVESMTPVKAIAAQLTSYKLNMGVYKPSRNRVVGDNLKETIEQNTTNLDEQFGKDIDSTLKDIVDTSQLSLYNSTPKDTKKELPVTEDDLGVFDVRNIIRNNIVVDGHTVARSYYDMHVGSEFVVKYKSIDNITKDTTRCYTALLNICDQSTNTFINVKSSELNLVGKDYILTTTINKNFNVGDIVTFSRGQIIVPGIIVDKNKIRLNKELVRKLNSNTTSWYNKPGFVITKNNSVNLLYGYSGDNIIRLDLVDNMLFVFHVNDTEKVIRISERMKNNIWYGINLNISNKLSLDLYSCDGILEHKFEGETSSIELPELSDIQFKLIPSEAYITNIRLFDSLMDDKNIQIKNLVTYNTGYDSHCIINDSADVYLNKEFVGVQR